MHDPGATEPADFSLALAIGPFGPRDLRVARVRGREQLSRPYAFDVTFASETAAITGAALLHQPACLTLAAHGPAPRDVLGRVARVRSVVTDEPFRRAFRVRIVPRLWRLSLGRASRVFQDRTVPEVVRAVLDSADIAHRWEIRADYPRRAYVVQYEESDLAFVTRLLSEVGILYRFDAPETLRDGAAEIVTFADSAAAPDLEGGAHLLLRSSAGSALSAGEDHVTSFSPEARTAPGSLTVRSYDFWRPKTVLAARVALAGDDLFAPDTCEHHDLDERAQQAESDLASAFLQQLRRKSRTAEGTSVCARLVPGRRFELDDHEDRVDPESVPSHQIHDRHAARTGAFTVVRVDHEARAPHTGGTAATYENRFTCIPAASVPRPPRPVRAVRQVAETAVVVGPEGAEIHTDELGRVQVRFPWQDAENASCWLRVVQAWAGAGWGAQMLPRVGMEVLVAFLGGDPARPVVAGCLPNATHPPPFALPANASTSGIRTRSTPGGDGSTGSPGHNELSFCDAKGAETVHLRAERDLTALVQNDATTCICRDETLAIGRHRSAKIGAVDTLDVGERLAITVAGSAFAEMSKDKIAHATSGGAVSGLVGGNAAIQAKGDVSITAGGSISLDAAGDVRIKAGGTVIIEAAGTLVLKGAVLTGEAAGAMTLQGASIDLNP